MGCCVDPLNPNRLGEVPLIINLNTYKNVNDLNEKTKIIDYDENNCDNKNNTKTENINNTSLQNVFSPSQDYENGEKYIHIFNRRQTQGGLNLSQIEEVLPDPYNKCETKQCFEFSVKTRCKTKFADYINKSQSKSVNTNSKFRELKTYNEKDGSKLDNLAHFTQVNSKIGTITYKNTNTINKSFEKMNSPIKKKVKILQEKDEKEEREESKNKIHSSQNNTNDLSKVNYVNNNNNNTLMGINDIDNILRGNESNFTNTKNINENNKSVLNSNQSDVAPNLYTIKKISKHILKNKSIKEETSKTQKDQTNKTTKEENKNPEGQIIQKSKERVISKSTISTQLRPCSSFNSFGPLILLKEKEKNSLRKGKLFESSKKSINWKPVNNFMNRTTTGWKRLKIDYSSKKDPINHSYLNCNKRYDCDYYLERRNVQHSEKMEINKIKFNDIQKILKINSYKFKNSSNLNNLSRLFESCTGYNDCLNNLSKDTLFELNNKYENIYYKYLFPPKLYRSSTKKINAKCNTPTFGLKDDDSYRKIYKDPLNRNCFNIISNRPKSKSFIKKEYNLDNFNDFKKNYYFYFHSGIKSSMDSLKKKYFDFEENKEDDDKSKEDSLIIINQKDFLKNKMKNLLNNQKKIQISNSVNKTSIKKLICKRESLKKNIFPVDKTTETTNLLIETKKDKSVFTRSFPYVRNLFKKNEFVLENAKITNIIFQK